MSKDQQKFSWIYMTCPNKEKALEMARLLVRERLVACANIFDSVTSIYHWEGKIQEDGEAILIAKSKADLFPGIEARVKEIHPYTCPCLIALPIQMGHLPYLQWIDSQTQKANHP